MIWTETFDSYASGKIEYWKCNKCGHYPAITVESMSDENDCDGPFCELHWIEFVTEEFRKLDRRLDNEDWGCSPDLNPQPPVVGICDICKQDLYKYYSLNYRQNMYKVCYNCYDKYSEK